MSLRILVISDNGPCAAYLADLMEGAGHAVTSMLQPGEALRTIRRQKPELIVLALEAPLVAPLAIEHRVQTPEGPRTVPVIVISEVLRLEAELLHVFDFIPKPVDVKRLLDGIAAVARRGAGASAPQEIGEDLCLLLAEHIRRCTGLHFDLRNRAALLRGIAKRMSALHMQSHAEYVAYLELHGEDRHELQKLLQFLTVGETYFFRYPSHFEALRERFLKNPPARGERIRIWSAGCSSGEEPYSIAITLMETFPDWRERDIKVIATDINNRSLRQARDGVYSPWAMRITEPHQTARYFERVGQSFLIKDEVKQLVLFSHLNLLAPCTEGVCSELDGLDAIFCRNVLIYFTPDTAQRMVHRFAQSLKGAGQLYLGHAEALLQHDPELEIRCHGKSFYYLKKRARKRAGLAHPEEPRAIAKQPAALQHEKTVPLPAVPQQAPGPAIGAASPAPSPPRANELEAARKLFDQEDFDQALTLLERLLREAPDAADALVLKGFIEAGKGELTQAFQTGCRVLELDDLLPDAYFLKGLILDAGDRLPEAAEEYRKALLLEHGFIMPRYHMGRLHLRLGRATEAAREIRNSIRLLARYDDHAVVPYSGGLTPAVCMLQLQNALAQVA